MCTQDQATTRANTLSDDADDIQRQLENEARDRIKYGRISQKRGSADKPLEEYSSLDRDVMGWDYMDQKSWSNSFRACCGISQSPVDLPSAGLVPVKQGRKLKFTNHDVLPESLVLDKVGSRVLLFGKWSKKHHPQVSLGAAHNRKYLFHSITLHWPSEHFVGGQQYPLETQALYISPEYKNIKEATEASTVDKLAMLGISSIYRYSNCTDPGLQVLLKAALQESLTVSVPAEPLKHFIPAMSEYACYHGSMTVPPCTEAVLWLVRRNTLPVTRDTMDEARKIVTGGGKPAQSANRGLQQKNDRKVYLFLDKRHYDEKHL